MNGIATPKRPGKSAETTPRGRILDAAFAAFIRKGYAATSTAEIAAAAHVSKREIYALVGNKREMLVACIGARAERLQLPADLAVPHDRDGLAGALTALGAQLIREVSDPTVIAVFRLAIAEAVHDSEVAQALDSTGRAAGRAALRAIMTGAHRAGLLAGDADECAEQFSGLLWGNLMVSLLLGVARRPKPDEIAVRARNAAAAFLRLHPPPDDDAPPRPPRRKS
jgi:AcrR family transcriptional regulator